VKLLARPRRAGGFTILEVLVAMAILLLGMSAVLGLLTFGAALTRTAELRNEGAAAVEGVLADLEESFFPLDAQGALQDPQPIVERPLAGLPGLAYSAKAERNPDRPKEWRVDVEVSWLSAGVRRDKSFRTILVQELPFGERLRRRLASAPTVPAPADPASTVPPSTTPSSNAPSAPR
jgi:prepilin-type N-terminal cleavage/methylation domain-containing protein